VPEPVEGLREELKKSPAGGKRQKEFCMKKSIVTLAVALCAVCAVTAFAQQVVGRSSLEDCRHIAIATIHKADVLASWNFKHIVNLDRIRGYNGVNLKNGYAALEIRNPRELLNYDKD
jgi:hypothetical protein